MEAEQGILEEGSWSKVATYSTVQGEKVNYRCNKARKKAPCSKALHILYHNDSQKASVYVSVENHSNHVTKEKIPKAAQDAIVGLFKDGISKPNAILSALKHRGIPETPKAQLVNYLASVRKKFFGNSSISIGELEKWCVERKLVPTDQDVAFVVDYNISANESAQLIKILISTLRLLAISKSALVIHADTTYKLVLQGLPVLLVGTTDRDKAFHPFGIAVCDGEKAEDFDFIFSALKNSVLQNFDSTMEPKCLQGDVSESITRGFEAVFGKQKRLICLFHMSKKIDEKLRPLAKTSGSEIHSDINVLQVCPTVAAFDKAADLFVQKWLQHDDSRVRDFITYFQDQWLLKQRLRFEGASLDFPSTNNALEATNATIKKEHTMRERLPLGQFMTLLLDGIVPGWSTGRDNAKTNSKVFSTRPSISLQDWTLAYQWATSNVEILKQQTDDLEKQTYYVASSEYITINGQISQTTINDYKQVCGKWATFDEFKNTQFSLWKIVISAQDFGDSTCSCPSFLKNYKCKHVNGLEIRMGILTPPLEAKNIQNAKEEGQLELSLLF